MVITDLRQIRSRSLLPLLEEEARYWLEQLRWDYRPSLLLIQKFIEARTLNGFAALDDGVPAGYGFYTLEDRKGLIGGLYVSPRFPQLDISRQLLAEILAGLFGTPKLERVEAQLIPFGQDLGSTLAENQFRLFDRQFMLLELTEPRSQPQASASLWRLEHWEDRFFESCARLIQLAYADHVDGEINDQYRSRAGAERFLKNIVLLRGCGQFLPEASFLLRAPEIDLPVAAVLTSNVSPGVGHTTQLCVLPGYQRQGLGRRLMQASIQVLRQRGFRGLSLTVTSSNAPAVRLYEQLGFATIKNFSAAVWQAQPRTFAERVGGALRSEWPPWL